MYMRYNLDNFVHTVLWALFTDLDATVTHVGILLTTSTAKEGPARKQHRGPEELELDNYLNTHIGS